jgi:hypothetical protein
MSTSATDFASIPDRWKAPVRNHAKFAEWATRLRDSQTFATAALPTSFVISHHGTSAGPVFEILRPENGFEHRTAFSQFHVSAETQKKFGLRMTALADSLARLVGIAHLVAYETDDEGAIVEAGTPGRTLTFYLGQGKTTAMFRSGGVNDFSQLKVHDMSASPTNAEIEQIARNYLVSFLCPTNREAPSQVTGLSVAA